MIVTAKSQLARMARYHLWATERLLGALEPIPDEDYRRDCGLFFGSVHGTLNHLLLTDGAIWYPRFTGGEQSRLPLDGEIESDRAALAAGLIAAVSRWSAYVEGLGEDELAGDLHFVMTTGQPRSLPRSLALLHLFNHATHHRGQVTAGISLLGFEYPSIDLAFQIFSEPD